MVTQARTMTESADRDRWAASDWASLFPMKADSKKQGNENPQRETENPFVQNPNLQKPGPRNRTPDSSPFPFRLGMPVVSPLQTPHHNGSSSTPPLPPAALGTDLRPDVGNPPTHDDSAVKILAYPHLEPSQKLFLRPDCCISHDPEDKRPT